MLLIKITSKHRQRSRQAIAWQQQ